MTKNQLLDVSNADAICALVTFGFLKKEFQKINIEYETPADGAKYKVISELFCALSGIPLRLTQTKSQAEMPHIIAQTRYISGPNAAKCATDENWTYINTLHARASKIGNLRGAYVGGLSEVGVIHLVGPSDLELYSPTYRTISASEQAAIDKAYSDAKVSTNGSIQCVSGCAPSNVKVILSDLIAPISRPYSPQSLFKSYHGMIQAMAKYKSTMSSSGFIFEIAMGNSTTKVSSCVPCSIYMIANGNAPTSIHLGRGDNWSIPKSNNAELERNWRQRVVGYYEEGERMFQGRLASYPSISNFLADFNICGCAKNEIPSIFLEALTFEKSFTDRIMQVTNLH